MKSKWPFISLIFVIFLAALSAIIVITLYLITFSTSKISNTPQDWGVFGDYFGGTFNPIVSIINLCVTIWIAIILNQFSDNQTEKQINVQKQVALTQIKHEAFNELRKELNRAFAEWENDKNHPPNVSNCILIMNSFSESYHQLFKLAENKSYKELYKELNDFKDELDVRNINLTSVRFANAKLFKAKFYGGLLLESF